MCKIAIAAFSLNFEEEMIEKPSSYWLCNFLKKETELLLYVFPIIRGADFPF